MVDRTITRRGFLRSAGAVAVSAPVLLSGCAAGEAATTWEQARESGKLKVGYAKELPYAYVDGSQRLTGAGPEVVRAVLSRMGITEIEGVGADYRQLVPGLKANRYAMVASHMTISPDRCIDARFSTPDFQSKSAFLVPKASRQNIASFDDVKKRKNVLIGVLTGSDELGQLVAAGVPEEQIVTLGDQDSLFRAVSDQRVYAALTLDTTADYLIKENQDALLQKTPPFETSGPNVGAFAFPRMQLDFVREFNKHLVKLHKSGEWAKIVEPFGFTEANDPKQARTGELCKA